MDGGRELNKIGAATENNLSAYVISFERGTFRVIVADWRVFRCCMVIAFNRKTSQSDYCLEVSLADTRRRQDGRSLQHPYNMIPLKAHGCTTRRLMVTNSLTRTCCNSSHF